MFGLFMTTAVGIGAGPALLAAASGLTTIYIICLIAGGGLLVISILFGSHSDMSVDHPLDADLGLDVDAHVGVDADVAVDADVPADVGADVHAGHADLAHAGVSLASWFSIQFVVYLVAVFGLVGTVLSYTTSLGPVPVLLIALGAGGAVGQGVHQTLRHLRRTSGDGAASNRDFVNTHARVTIAIGPGQWGEVAVHVRGRERFVPAVARRADDRFDVGDRVGIVAFANGTAEVVSRQEYDFINEPKVGDDA